VKTPGPQSPGVFAFLQIVTTEVPE
jgi:hypothetical protein